MNIGIIGCGSIARKRHAPEYSQNPNTTIIGFYDLNPDRAREMTELYGGKVYLTIDAMLEDESIDAISVCTANVYHAPITIQALNHKKHVLCEKPMATTLSECEAMLEASLRNGKRLMIGHNQRLTPTILRAKEILDSGTLGRVLTFTTTFGHKGPELWSVDQSRNTWFFKKDWSAFGSLADLGIHKVDLIRYLLGDQVESVYSVMATLDKQFENGQPIDVDDNSITILRFRGGTLGTVTSSWTYYGAENNATVLYCEKGTMAIYTHPTYSLEITYTHGEKVHYEIDNIQTNDRQTSTGVIDLFINGILKDERTIIDASEIIDSMRVIFAGLESANRGTTVTL